MSSWPWRLQLGVQLFECGPLEMPEAAFRHDSKWHIRGVFFDKRADLVQQGSRGGFHTDDGQRLRIARIKGMCLGLKDGLCEQRDDPIRAAFGYGFDFDRETLGASLNGQVGPSAPFHGWRFDLPAMGREEPGYKMLCMLASKG